MCISIYINHLWFIKLILRGFKRDCKTFPAAPRTLEINLHKDTVKNNKYVNVSVQLWNIEATCTQGSGIICHLHNVSCIVQAESRLGLCIKSSVNLSVAVNWQMSVCNTTYKHRWLCTLTGVHYVSVNVFINVYQHYVSFVCVSIIGHSNLYLVVSPSKPCHTLFLT